MEIRLHKKHIIVLISSIILIILVYFGAYFLFQSPTNYRINQMKENVKLLEKQLNILASSDQEETTANSYLLQQNIPVKPSVDQFVLDLEKAEVVSNSKIQTVEFTEDGEQQATEEEQVFIEDEQVNNVTNTTEQETTNEAAPEGLKKLSIALTVSSNSYHDLRTFVETIEQQTRLTNVEKLSFLGPPELTQVNQDIDRIEYQLQLTSFYFPTLTDLEDEMPTIDPPMPSSKNNPLTTNIIENYGEQP